MTRFRQRPARFVGLLPQLPLEQGEIATVSEVRRMVSNGLAMPNQNEVEHPERANLAFHEFLAGFWS
jgi:hypothetical protein